MKEINIQGVYVAGDLRPKALRQIVTAVSDGAMAATSAERYVLELKEKLGIKDEYEPKKVEKKDKLKVMSVPAIIVNDEQIYFGAKKIDEIINLIK